MESSIEARSLSKSYGGAPAIEDVSFSVGKGRALGLLGPNGAGKSTTIECLLGTDVPDTGGSLILGLDPQKDRRALFARVGVQFQDCDYQPEIRVGELCEETACLYPAPADWRAICKDLGIGDKGAAPVKSLSGGQRQRLFIVLALIPDPEVVFFDELTTGLDAAARREVWHILKGLKDGGMTMLLTSHFMDEVEAVCDEGCVLRKGRVTFQGTVDGAKSATGRSDFEEAYLALTGEGA